MNVKYLLASVLVVGQGALANGSTTQENTFIEVAEPAVNIVKIIDFTGTREQVEQAFNPPSATLNTAETKVAVKEAAPKSKPNASEKTTKPAKSSTKTEKKDEAIQSRTFNRAYSYTVRGKRYHAMKDAKGFEQYGKASWYGPGFHGRKTANGERYDMHAMTAAHKELPLGSKIEVTNTSNGRKVVVRINDRGPFHGNRVLDLSKAAADKLGVLHQGVANVHIRVIQ